MFQLLQELAHNEKLHLFSAVISGLIDLNFNMHMRSDIVLMRISLSWCLHKQHSAAYKLNSFEWLKILLTINEIHLQLGRIAIPRNSLSELSVIGKLGKLIMIDKINYEMPNAFNWIYNICYCHKCSPIYMGKVMRTCCL